MTPITNALLSMALLYSFWKINKKTTEPTVDVEEQVNLNYRIQDIRTTGFDPHVYRSNNGMLATRGKSERENTLVYGTIEDMMMSMAKQQEAIRQVAYKEIFDVRREQFYNPKGRQPITFITPISEDHPIIPSNYPYVMPTGDKPKIGRVEDPL